LLRGSSGLEHLSRPALRQFQIDLVYLGVISVVNMAIGRRTPPCGVLLFVVNG
jgi:TRAP-type C4-dicarboxylate transport system permease large subunit